jgi:hypothetical protein
MDEILNFKELHYVDLFLPARASPACALIFPAATAMTIDWMAPISLLDIPSFSASPKYRFCAPSRKNAHKPSTVYSATSFLPY